MAIEFGSRRETFENYKVYETMLAGRPFKVEMGKMCGLSNASALIRYGETCVMCNVVMSPKPREGVDFFPLNVEYEEKLYAAGRIPGSFMRREGRPGERAILTSRVVDRPIEHVIPQLVAIEESDDVEGLLIILNTVGGDVEAGLAIAELLSTMRTPTASLVLGGGHSIGVPLAVSCRRSFIVPSATMTVHPVRMNGLVLGVPQTLSYFEKMQDRIVRFIAHNAKISADDFRALMMKTGELVMDVGTVLDGAGAVDCGLIDQMGGLSDALAFLNRTIEEEHHAVDCH